MRFIIEPAPTFTTPAPKAGSSAMASMPMLEPMDWPAKASLVTSRSAVPSPPGSGSTSMAPPCRSMDTRLQMSTTVCMKYEFERE